MIFIEVGNIADLRNCQPSAFWPGGSAANLQRTEHGGEISQSSVAQRLIAEYQDGIFVDGAPNRRDIVIVDGTAQIDPRDFGREPVAQWTDCERHDRSFR